MSQTHEDFGRDVLRKGPSDRAFGLVFFGVFLVFGVSPLLHGKPIRIWCLALSGVIFLVTVSWPSLLHSLNLRWSKLGQLLGEVVNPVVTAVLFYLVFTPAAMLLRWMGRDGLGISLDPGAETYWIQRGVPHEVSPGMEKQF
jgi:hypothetical protein